MILLPKASHVFPSALSGSGPGCHLIHALLFLHLTVRLQGRSPVMAAAAALWLLGLFTFTSLTGKGHKDETEKVSNKWRLLTMNPIFTLQLLFCSGSPGFTGVSSFSLIQGDVTD